eukprot:c12223_g1_i1 orf=456-869(+)
MECFKYFSAQWRTQVSSCLSKVFLRKLSIQWPKHLSTKELYILKLSRTCSWSIIVVIRSLSSSDKLSKSPASIPFLPSMLSCNLATNQQWTFLCYSFLELVSSSPPNVSALSNSDSSLDFLKCALPVYPANYQGWVL